MTALEAHPDLLAVDHTDDGWPCLAPTAFQGPIGAYVEEAAPYTEADPAALLAQTLTVVGCLAGRGPYALAGNDRHPASLFVGIVGETANAKKGTSYNGARCVAEKIDDAFTRHRISGGFGSGEALIDFLAPPKADEEHPRPHDSRALVREGELASVLKVAARERSTLGPVLRNGWDGQPLSVHTRTHGEVTASGYHLSVIGHITMEELRATLSDADVYGGTVNRFLWIAARRAQLLPEGGNIPETIIAYAAKAIGDNVRTSHRFARMERSPIAKTRWDGLYRRMAEDHPPGLLGHAVARAEAQCLRLSVAYAVADGSRQIELEHLEAAWALWSYARATAELIFPRSTTDEDCVLAAVRAQGPAGLNRSAVYELFHNNTDKNHVGRIISGLEQRNLITVGKGPSTGGRRPVILTATETGS